MLSSLVVFLELCGQKQSAWIEENIEYSVYSKIFQKHFNMLYFPLTRSL